MRVFLTGGTGYIGSFITLELLRGGHEVTVLARDSSSHSSLLEMDGVTILVGDLERLDQIAEHLAGHDACIHNAIIWGDEQWEHELRDSSASLALFRSAAKAGIEQLVYTSSVAVHRPFQAQMDERTRIAPVESYGAIKACNEMLLSSISHQTKMRCNVVRPGPTVGAPALSSAPFHSDRRFTDFAAIAKQKEEIKVPKDDGRQFIAASDLAKVYAAILTSDANRETFIAVADDFVTWESIANETVAVVGSGQVAIEDRETMPHRFDTGKVQRALGLQFSSKNAITEHIRYIAEH